MSSYTPSISSHFELQRRLRLRCELSPDQANFLINGKLSHEAQCAALAGLLLRDNLSEHETDAVRALGDNNSEVYALFQPEAVASVSAANADETSCWWRAINSLIHKKLIGYHCLSAIVKRVAVGSDSTFVSALLMSICVCGMEDHDILLLTQLMADSGARYDYRDEKALRGARLVRRYPTGALSEKVALILPALIACARDEVNVCTPFLVARSLGYTGGTWDKLSAVPGFIFPEPGDDSIATLLECGVAMTVTKNDANPADRFLYQLRSVTGTIESMPLIVASIASKQICFPVHRLLMDIRYGRGAFLERLDDAEKLGETLRSVLNANDVNTFFTITDTEQPTGSAIGNALEVAEAIAVMGGKGSAWWDPRSLLVQRELTVHFFAKLMNAEFPVKSELEWAAYAEEQFNSGAILRAFGRILHAHKVSCGTVTNLLSDPFSALKIPKYSVDVVAGSSGILTGIDQRQFGEIINRTLNGGRNDIEGAFDPTVGAIIAHRLGDKVLQGSVLCRVFAEREVVDPLRELLEDCFLWGKA